MLEYDALLAYLSVCVDVTPLPTFNALDIANLHQIKTKKKTTTIVKLKINVSHRYMCTLQN